MTKFVFTLCLFFLPLAVNAQFKSTYDGFRTSDNHDYLVLNYDQKSVHDLYTLTLKWINRTQYNPNIYTKNVEDETIYIHSGDTIKLPGLIKITITINYGLNFEFKDGKVRFLPIIHSFVPNIFFGYEGKKNNLANVVLFKPDGSCRGKNGRVISKALDKWINDIVREYDEFMTSSGGDGEW